MIWGWYSSEGSNSFRICHHLKKTFSIQLKQALKLSKLGCCLERKIKAAFSWNAGNYKTGLGLQTVRQDGPGLRRELTSLLITCISLAAAKGARLVAPGTVHSIYPQSRYSTMAGYHRDANPCYNSSHPGTWGEEGDEVSALSLLWLPTRGPVPWTISEGWDPKLQGLWKGNNGAPVYLWDRRTRDSFLCITF